MAVVQPQVGADLPTRHGVLGAPGRRERITDAPLAHLALGAGLAAGPAVLRVVQLATAAGAVDAPGRAAAVGAATADGQHRCQVQNQRGGQNGRRLPELPHFPFPFSSPLAHRDKRRVRALPTIGQKPGAEPGPNVSELA